MKPDGELSKTSLTLELPKKGAIFNLHIENISKLTILGKSFTHRFQNGYYHVILSIGKKDYTQVYIQLTIYKKHIPENTIPSHI